MGGSSPSSGESTLWQSLAEPRFSGGRSQRRRPQSNNDSSDPGLDLVRQAPSPKNSDRAVSARLGPRLPDDGFPAVRACLSGLPVPGAAAPQIRQSEASPAYLAAVENNGSPFEVDNPGQPRDVGHLNGRVLR